jgi:hypothetical protein
MLFKIVFVGMLVAAAMMYVKQGRVMQRLGLTGSCSVVATPVGQDGEWRACKPGRLAGRPDLSLNSCESQSLVGKVEYWRCPASVAPNALRQ